MLKYCDSFDHVAMPDGGAGVPFVTTSPLGVLGWTAQYVKDLIIRAGLGRFGTNQLDMGYSTYTKRFALSRSCTRLVVGFAFKRNGTTASSDNFTVGFGYGTFENFRVTCTMTTARGLPYQYGNVAYSGLVFSYTTGNGSGYPTIPDSPYVSTPFMMDTIPGSIRTGTPHFTFLEIYIDVADYKNGTVKIAVNGRTVHVLTGIVTCAYNGFGDNPYDPKAKLNSVNFGKGASDGGCFLSLDSMYICDDDGGYNNDFLGDIFVKTIYLASDGDKVDWSPYINGLAAPDDTPRVALIDDPVFDPAVEPDYIQADQDLVQETMSIGGGNIPVESTLIAVNHRTAARSVASPGAPPQNTLIPLYKSQGNDIIVTNSLAKKFTGWTYQFLDVYYNLVPGLAVDWTELLLDESQFGFMLRESIWTGVTLEEIGFADEVIDE